MTSWSLERFINFSWKPRPRKRRSLRVLECKKSKLKIWNYFRIETWNLSNEHSWQYEVFIYLKSTKKIQVSLWRWVTSYILLLSQLLLKSFSLSQVFEWQIWIMTKKLFGSKTCLLNLTIVSKINQSNLGHWIGSPWAFHWKKIMELWILDHFYLTLLESRLLSLS